MGPFCESIVDRLREKSAHSIAAGKFKNFKSIRKTKGYFIYLAIVLEDPDDLRVILEIDRNKILDDTHNDLEAQAEGDMNLDTGDNAGNLIHIPDSTASYYVIVFDAHANPFRFEDGLDLTVHNDNASNAYKVQSIFFLWSTDRR